MGEKPPTIIPVLFLPEARIDKNADFSLISIGFADFSKAQLKDTNFSGAILRKSWFVDAYCKGTKFISADLTGARFGDNESFEQLSSCETHLEKTDFTNAILDRANFRGVDIGDSIFYGASLKKTNFRGVDLSRAKDLTWEQIKNANIDDKTKLPQNAIDERDAEQSN